MPRRELLIHGTQPSDANSRNDSDETSPLWSVVIRPEGILCIPNVHFDLIFIYSRLMKLSLVCGRLPMRQVWVLSHLYYFNRDMYRNVRA